MTLSGSETTRNLTEVSVTENETVYKTQKGHTLRVLHEKKGDVTVCRTVFENTSSEDTVIELLSSFAIRDLDADRMHRATSFWSAEGKLLSQSPHRLYL